MKTVAIMPGTILEARPLSPEFLAAQWASEMMHASASLNLSELAFSDDDWAAWEWNAREVIHLNTIGGSFLAGMRLLFGAQTKINFHLLHAYRNLIAGWRQWEKLEQVTDQGRNERLSELTFLLVSALGRLEQAEVKSASMENQKHKVLQAASMRQLRFYQQLTALLVDLNPVMIRAESTREFERESVVRLESTKRDIEWHEKELLRLLGSLELQPSFYRRLRIPRVQVNQLLANACLFHALHLKTILGISTT